MKGDDYVFGMIGLGTMGRNLLLNMADHGYKVAGHDKDEKKTTQLGAESKKENVKGFVSLREFIDSLKKPRAIMMLVPAGKIVDSVIDELIPRSEEHTSELQSHSDLVCRLLLEKKN